MIIHAISATNILKYERLELQDLPQQGLITISGFNESGKSSIGESICFALFGRTFSIGDDSLDKIIRWGASDCEVTVKFSNTASAESSDELYAITRMLDCDGNHSAKLYKVGNEDNPIARGIKRVQEALFNLTAVEYDEFIESFYLAQREITTPHPHSHALKNMAGLATMERCSGDINNDIKYDSRAIDELQQNITDFENEVNQLNIDSTHFDELNTEHDNAQQALQQVEETHADYQSAIDAYNEAEPQLNTYNKKKSHASLWRFIFLILALGLFSLWWIVAKMPDTSIHESLSEVIKSSLPQITALHLLVASIVSLILVLFFWATGISHSSNIKRLQQSGKDLSEAMRSLDHSQKLPEDKERKLQISQVEACQVNEQQLKGMTKTDLRLFIQQQKEQSKTIKKLSKAIEIERERIKRFSQLEEKTDSLNAQLEGKMSRNQSRELALKLLTGAAHHRSKCFNHVIRDHVAKTLPLFTEDRYEHLQIDENLSVRVFSNEKHNFLDLDEISSGTQRQIMLAVRLALSQEMVSRKVQAKQFLILDEPFAFFDKERTEYALSLLPKLSDDLPQVWVIDQSFPQSMQFERRIHCERNSAINQNLAEHSSSSLSSS